MSKRFAAILIAGVCTSIISFAQPEQKLAKAFVQSVAKNNFQLMAPYMVNAATAKKLFGAEFSKIPSAKQAGVIKSFTAMLNKKWNTAVANAKTNKVDFSKLKIKEVKLAEIPDQSKYASLLIVYTYNNLDWDDLLLFVNKAGDQKYLLEIPTDTYMFAFNDQRRGKNLQEIENMSEKKEDLKFRLHEEVIGLQELATAGLDSLLTLKLIYRGEDDKTSRWKRRLDPDVSSDFELGKDWVKKIKKQLTNCPEIETGDVRVEKESEGTWNVIEVICGSKKYHYAFLKVDNKFLLGDIDTSD